jgi:hypothetical protein
MNGGRPPDDDTRGEDDAGQMVHVEIPQATPRRPASSGEGSAGSSRSSGSPTEYHTTQFSETQGGAIYGADGDKRGTRVYFDVDDINAGSARRRARRRGGRGAACRAWLVRSLQGRRGNEFGIWQTDRASMG